jgi:ApaG protein
MSMQKTKSTAHNFEVSVKALYVPAQSKPDQHFHFFAYRILIQNKGSAPAQLMNRHWIITDGFGRIEEVRGPGVIGQQPKIQPGQSFEYESACPLQTSSGSMKGSYEMTSESGETFSIEVPEFFLIAPQSLH